MTDAVWNVEELSEKDWQLLRKVRLAALEESPNTFLAERDHEVSWDQPNWRRMFQAARWYVARSEDAEDAIGLLRSVRCPGESRWREIESIWVAPAYRKRGVFRSMLRAVSASERAVGANDLFLWVIEDNHEALHVYTRLGFEATGICQPIPGCDGRFERRLHLRLPATLNN